MAVIVFTGFINFRAYFITAPADADVQRGFSTGAVKAAEYYSAKDNYDNIFVDVEIWEKRAFDFTAAAAGKPPYKQFEFEKIIPGTYILPAYHRVLIDSVFKVLYPQGELIPFYDGDNAAEYSYFAYETGGQAALSHSDKNGLTMKVYQSQDFRSPVMEEKTVPVIFMDRDYGAHSREWTGKIKAPLSGRYTFMVHSVGLSQLYLDGKKAVENQGYGKGRQQSEAVIHLDKGMHDIVVKYTQGMELAKIELWWAVPGEKLKPVSINVLFTENK